jgi:hypothetical protein
MPVPAPGRVGLGEPERGQVGHGAQPGGEGVLQSHREDQIVRPEVGVLDVRSDLDEADLLDGGRADSLRLQVRHPLADVAGHDLVHPHRPEPRHNVLVELVGVPLAGGRLDHVVGHPLLGDVAAERLPAAPGIAETPLSLSQLRLLPRLVGVLLAGEGSGRAAVTRTLWYTAV